MRSTIAAATLTALLALTGWGDARPSSSKKSSSKASAAAGSTKSKKKKSSKGEPKTEDDSKRASKDDSKDDEASEPDEKPPQDAESDEEEGDADDGEAESEMHSPAMVGAGVALSIVGTGAIVGGTSWLYARRSAHSLFSYSPAYPGIVIGGGGALLITGIALWVVGAGDAEDEPAAKGSAVRVTPLVGPASVGLDLRF
ncbi:MAG: hypothetical protein JRI23_21030 [Deltaproteobacteria bacterium]|jgi:hypothetical protein|nr:hypothetical protein [Deltaproteobacteria bacterium]MBW2534418.1 hypothetical protein [Deltaproteobacteria bacterium]